MGSGDGSPAGLVQKVLRDPVPSPSVHLEGPGTTHPQDGGFLHHLGGFGRGTETYSSKSCSQS